MAARIKKRALSKVRRNKAKKNKTIRASNQSICIRNEKPLHKLKTKQLADGKRLLQHGDTRVIINNTPITGGMEGTIHEAELVGEESGSLSDGRSTLNAWIRGSKGWRSLLRYACTYF